MHFGSGNKDQQAPCQQFILRLKGVRHEIFDKNFFHDSNSYGPLENRPPQSQNVRLSELPPHFELKIFSFMIDVSVHR